MPHILRTQKQARAKPELEKGWASVQRGPAFWAPQSCVFAHPTILSAQFIRSIVAGWQCACGIGDQDRAGAARRLQARAEDRQLAAAPSRAAADPLSVPGRSSLSSRGSRSGRCCRSSTRYRRSSPGPRRRILWAAARWPRRGAC
eukprot:2501708-Prymnesium_polylepis.1